MSDDVPPLPDDTAVLRLRYRRRLIAGTIILLLLAVPSIVHSTAAIKSMRNLPANWLPDSMGLKQDFMKFVTRFGVTDLILVSWPTCELNDPSVARVERVLNQLTAETSPPILDDAVDSSTSETERIQQIRSISGSTSPLAWVRSGTSIRERLTQPPLNLSLRAAAVRLRGTVVGNDGQRTCVILSLGPSLLFHQREVLPIIREIVASTAGVNAGEVAMVGGPVDGAEVDGESIRSIQQYSLPSSLIAAILCWLCLRSVPLTVVVVGVATIGQGMVLALVYYGGQPMNAVLIVLPPLVFVLTVSSGIHLSNYFLDIARHSQQDAAIIAKRAMKIGTRPCWMASLTTVIGLASLLLVRLTPVQTFGGVAAIGVLGSLALLLWMMPGAMCMVDTSRIFDRYQQRSNKKKTVAKTDTTTPRAGELWVPPAVVLLVAACLTAASALGVTRLTTSVSVPAMFDFDSPLRTQYREFEQSVAATMPGDIMVRFAPSELADKDQRESILNELAVVAKLHAAVSRLPTVGGAQSALTFLPPLPNRSNFAATVRRSLMRAELGDRDGEISRLGFLNQETTNRVWRIHVRFFQTGSPVEQLTQTDERTSRTPAIHRGDFDAAINEVQNSLQQTLGEIDADERPTATITGHVVLVQRSQELLLRDMFKSFIAAFGVIAVLMMIYLKSIRGGMLAMIPNVIPTLVLFGLMGWLSRPLDIGSVMTASLALGIAIDDTVHLLMRYRAIREKQAGRSVAAIQSVRQCGVAMTQTTIVCGFSLLAYALSDFVPTRQFAFFMLGLLVIALACVTSVLPAMMATRWGDWFVGVSRKLTT